MESFRPGSTAEPPSRNPAKSYPTIQCTRYVSLEKSLDNLSLPMDTADPEPMEHYGQSFGFIHYSTIVDRLHSGEYILRNMRDRAIIMLDGKPFQTIYRNDIRKTVNLYVPHDGAKLEILVENMGRVNFCTEMEYELKGMRGFETVGHTLQLSSWTTRLLPLDNISNLRFDDTIPAYAEPGFHRAILNIDEPADTFIKLPGGVRGYVYVNGFNIGRYWCVGPQKTLFVPAPLLRRGDNTIVVFELHGLTDKRIEFVAQRDIGVLEEMPLS